ncbi:MAG: MCE family protein [Nocardioidaceae bacterium]|nr:MCE family protein [Nocardioidaceae bacterium]MCL2614574.1 MCE family protein [Nocardioidaceae bacterium]
MSAAIQRFLPLTVILLLVAGGAVWLFSSGSGNNTVTAYFPRAVSVYQGSDVRVLGVAVGKVDQVVPEGTQVKVVMHYDKNVKIPADAKAVIVSPAIVGDRYVQLAPAYKAGPVMKDNTIIKEDNTSVPLELDQIYGSLDKLTVALGPNGANKKGALTDLLNQTARNFGGQGAEVNHTIKQFGKLSATLNDNKDVLFHSATKLESFMRTLAKGNKTVRGFNTSLGKVSTMLAGERKTLSLALTNLGTALDTVGHFVQHNRGVLRRNISGLDRVSKVLVKRRSQLAEILRAGPLAISNLAHAYDPQTGTLNTNANLGNLATELLTHPTQFACDLIASQDSSGKLCNLIKGLGLPRVQPFGTGSAYGQPYDPTLNGMVPTR